MNDVRFVPLSYSHDTFLRFKPRLSLKDLDCAMVTPVLNSNLAEKLKAVHVYANGYKLLDIQREAFKIDSSSFDPNFPVEFSADELADGWVRIRPSGGASNFWLDFYGQTPKKQFSPTETVDSLARPPSRRERVA